MPVNVFSNLNWKAIIKGNYNYYHYGYHYKIIIIIIISVPHFSVFGKIFRFSRETFVFSRNIGKYRPESTQYTDTFYTLLCIFFSIICYNDFLIF